MLRADVLVGALLVGLVVMTGPSSSANPPLGEPKPAPTKGPVDYSQVGSTDGAVTVVASSSGSVPGSGGGSRGSSGSADAASQRSGVSRSCSHDGEVIPCHVRGAFWSAGRDFYVRRADPQPVVSSVLWDGHRDSRGDPVGVIYQCLAPGAPPSGYDSWFSAFWVPDGGFGGVEVVDPVVLAERAVARMGLRAGRVGATPLPGAGARSVVGLPTWLWVDDVGETTWGPISRTATAGSVSVTATASVAGVVFDMGDGGSVRCTSPGTVWTPSAGSGPSPDCGYRYRQPGEYTIRAVSHWVVDWRGGGQSGTLHFSLTSRRDITVTQLQVVVTR